MGLQRGEVLLAADGDVGVHEVAELEQELLRPGVGSSRSASAALTSAASWPAFFSSSAFSSPEPWG